MKWKLKLNLNARDTAEMRDLTARLNTLRRIMASLLKRKKTLMARGSPPVPKVKPIPRQPSLF